MVFRCSIFFNQNYCQLYPTFTIACLAGSLRRFKKEQKIDGGERPFPFFSMQTTSYTGYLYFSFTFFTYHQCAQTIVSNSEALPVLASLASLLIKAYLILLLVKMQVYTSLNYSSNKQVTPVAKRFTTLKENVCKVVVRKDNNKNLFTEKIPQGHIQVT